MFTSEHLYSNANSIANPNILSIIDQRYNIYQHYSSNQVFLSYRRKSKISSKS